MCPQYISDLSRSEKPKTRKIKRNKDEKAVSEKKGRANIWEEYMKGLYWDEVSLKFLIKF